MFTINNKKVRISHVKTHRTESRDKNTEEAAGELPPLLQSLLLRHPEGEASLVVHAAHHLLPAVV